MRTHSLYKNPSIFQDLPRRGYSQNSSQTNLAILPYTLLKKKMILTFSLKFNQQRVSETYLQATTTMIF